jgi:hypothetical protein
MKYREARRNPAPFDSNLELPYSSHFVSKIPFRRTSAHLRFVDGQLHRML